MIKKIFTYVFSTLLIAVYVLSYIGFSVHKCSCEGTTEVSLLIGNADCEHLHAHINLTHDSESHSQCHHDHHDGCCTSEVLVLTSDQNNPDGDYIIVPAEIDFSFYMSDNTLFIEDYQKGCAAYIETAPPIYSDKNDLSIISVWRL